MFRRKQQQDAHELLCCLLDGLASEGGNFVKSTFGGRLRSTVTCHACQTVPSLFLFFFYFHFYLFHHFVYFYL